MKKLFGLALVLTLAGCGDSADFEEQLVNQNVVRPSLSGQVLAEDGSALAGVTVVAQERTTNQEVRVTSGADGSFQANLPAGVYDVLLDKDGDPTTATSFYGPVKVNTAVQQSFTLRDAGGRSASTVFGKILSRPGVPAAGRTIVLRPGFILADVDEGAFQPVQGTTDAEGNFSLELSTSEETAFDLDVQEAGGGLDEFIDLSKVDKACYAEFSVDENSTENAFRSNQSPPPAVDVLAAQNVSAQASPFLLIPFDLNFIPDDGGTAVFSNGGVGGTGQTVLANAAKSVPQDPTYDKLIGLVERTSIAVDDTGSRFWSNAVYVNPDTETLWHFTDAGNDTYSLYVFNTNNAGDPNFQNWHVVHYNSLEPGITRITFRRL
jgi:hypothetical protein